MLNLLLGDHRFFWPENIEFFARLPSAWDSSLNTGIGMSSINTIWITSYLNLTSVLSHLGMSWFVISLFFWVIPTLITGFLGVFFLFRKIISENPIYAVFSGVIFTTNTYFLTVFLGGQQGVSFAYAFVPLVFLTFINLFRNQNPYTSIIFSLTLALQLLFDPRFFLLTVGGLLLFYLLQFKLLKKHLVYVVLVPFFIIFLLHSYWIIPLILFKPEFLPEGFESIEGLKFFSFAFFENSLSLLHPNWPENIFGKTYFMKPEFLAIPILAFGSLLFLKNSKRLTLEQSNDRTILFFALLALLSAFFAKGANEPLGEIFVWLFKNIPGFSLFRDPTKFYSLIALSYSILIPYSLLKFSAFSKKKILGKIIVASFIILWLLSLRLFPLEDVSQIHKVPQSYIQLKDFIFNQKKFFRTLWVPSWQRYGYFSDMNPAIGRAEIFREASASGIIRELHSEEMLRKLQKLSVKYLIVPEDSEDEIFQEDRKYDEKLYLETIREVENIKWLERADGFGKMAVFEINNPRDHFWSPSEKLRIDYKYINPTKYSINIKNARKGDTLVFSESYDKHWLLYNSKYRIKSSPFEKRFNSFIIPEKRDQSFTLYYTPQDFVNIGLVVSAITLVGILAALIGFRLKKW